MVARTLTKHTRRANYRRKSKKKSLKKNNRGKHRTAKRTQRKKQKGGEVIAAAGIGLALATVTASIYTGLRLLNRINDKTIIKRYENNIFTGKKLRKFVRKVQET